MKKIMVIMSALLVSVALFAGSLRLSDGNVIMWDSETSRIEYESYRVEIQLYETSNHNVWGTVTLGGQTKNFMISAGEKRTYVDFDNLTNGKFYQVSLKVNN